MKKKQEEDLSVDVSDSSQDARVMQRNAATSSSVFASAVDQEKVNLLIEYVAKGKEREAEELLRANRGLALHPGTVTDYSGRNFRNITAFQYALRALDSHMWRMILKYLPQDQAALQLKDFESNGTDHGAHYDFDSFIRVFDVYRNKESEADDLFGPVETVCYDIGHFVCRVGQAQRFVPVHVANQYCRPDRSFNPLPDFKNDTSLPRQLQIGPYSHWYPLGRGLLGKYYAVYRANRPGGADTNLPYLDRAYYCRMDLAALEALRDARVSQFKELCDQLLPQAAASGPALVS